MQWIKKKIYEEVKSEQLTIGVNFVDHVLKFGLSRILTQRPHDGAELLGGDGAIAIFVEEGEGFTDLLDFILSEAWSLEDLSSYG